MLVEDLLAQMVQYGIVQVTEECNFVKSGEIG